MTLRGVRDDTGTDGPREPLPCTLPIDTLRAELRGPAAISHALEFAVRADHEPPIRLMIPQRR